MTMANGIYNFQSVYTGATYTLICIFIQCCPLDMQEDFTTAQSYLLVLGEETEEKEPKRRLPKPVTVPKRGPLALKTAICQHLPDKTAPNSQKPKVFTNPKYRHRPKHSLIHCSFPLRPLEQIEDELGELSCAQLRDSLELMTVSLHEEQCHICTASIILITACKLQLCTHSLLELC